MQDYQRDETLKARLRQAEPGLQPKRLGWASALGNAAVQRLLRSVGLRRYSGGETVDDALARASSRRNAAQARGWTPACGGRWRCSRWTCR